MLYFQLKKKHKDLQKGAFHWFLVESKNIFNYKKEFISKIKQSISQSQFKKYSSLIFKYFEICEKNKNKLIKSIINTQNNFSIIVNFLVDNFDRSKYIYDKKDILEMLQSELSLLIGLFLPEFRYLNKIIIQQLNIPLEIPKIHFIVSMFILQAFFSWYTISHTMYFTPISLKTNIFLHKTNYFIEESVKLRTILILLCKEVQLEHCKRLLENITSRYLMYFSFSHKENQSKLFWYYLGNLIVFKNYGEPKECKKFLEDNFYQCLSLNNLLLNLENQNDFEIREKLKILMKQKTIATADISDFSFLNLSMF
ncbi:hypothetical protein TUBRATIS_16010 [Tubulinosema ratisbonensis]|uniref:Uncharacterized protein n=1 Tax=Tubulinosema ratisbonensis TaxID=291195 RepID=A0A437ALB3_9MICR|nr:hypothetical protein TUBRATIS_16010 [Tubulinosema ratisbonensis]